MAKVDKNIKKAASKKADSIKEKPRVPVSAKEILAKAAALAKSSSKKVQITGKKTSSSSSSDSSESPSGESDSDEEKSPPVKLTANSAKKAESSSDDSSDASSSEESLNEESDVGDKRKAPTSVKTPSAAVQKKVYSSDDSSDASKSEESSSEDNGNEEEATSVLGRTNPNKFNKEKKTSDSKDESSDASSSERSSSESDSDEEDDKTSVEANKKRKAVSEAAIASKKVKLANGSADAVTSGEETKSIFVGRLSWNVDNDWLAQEFAECGEVEYANVQMDRNTGRSRGFGHVHFKTADAVEKALALNGKEIDGRAINVDRSNPPDKKSSAEKRAQAFGDTPSPPSAVLFVGNLSFGVNEDTLWETFSEHGDIKSVRVPTDRDTGRPKGFAYVEFSEVGAAKKACGALQGFELDGRSLRLDFSQPRDSASGRGFGQSGRSRGRGGFGGDRGRGGGRGGGGRGGGRGGRGGDRGGRGRGRGGRTGGITHFEGQKITFD